MAFIHLAGMKRGGIGATTGRAGFSGVIRNSNGEVLITRAQAALHAGCGISRAEEGRGGKPLAGLQCEFRVGHGSGSKRIKASGGRVGICNLRKGFPEAT
jgi:hypothetical protein